jgi:hypothetical protein
MITASCNKQASRKSERLLRYSQRQVQTGNQSFAETCRKVFIETIKQTDRGADTTTRLK